MNEDIVNLYEKLNELAQWCNSMTNQFEHWHSIITTQNDLIAEQQIEINKLKFRISALEK